MPKSRPRKPRRSIPAPAVTLGAGALLAGALTLVITWATNHPRAACGVVELLCREVKQAEPPPLVPPPVPIPTPTAGGPPPDPVPGQVRARDGVCPRLARDIGGWCWYSIGSPPCPDDAREYERSCYLPATEGRKMPSVQDPRRGWQR